MYLAKTNPWFKYRNIILFEEINVEKIFQLKMVY